MISAHSWCLYRLVGLMLLAWPIGVWAHGFAGQRFFPTTLAIDDPFVVDELSFLVEHRKERGNGEEPATFSTAFEGEYTKRITQQFGVSLGGALQHLDPEQGSDVTGFRNLEVGAKYQLLTSPRAEALLSVGLTAEIGGTGARSAGAERVSTLSPGLFFGVGGGMLPETVAFLRPLAVTGALSLNIPTRRRTVITQVDSLSGESTQEIERHPITLSWGVTLQYNLQYLQTVVKDVGLGAPFHRMIPLVELALETCLNRGCHGQTTGTVNPGLIWVGKYIQLGVEATVPINARSGKNVGVLGLVHVFLDDLLPHSLGRPLFP